MLVNFISLSPLWIRWRHQNDRRYIRKARRSSNVTEIKRTSLEVFWPTKMCVSLCPHAVRNVKIAVLTIDCHFHRITIASKTMLMTWAPAKYTVYVVSQICIHTIWNVWSETLCFVYLNILVCKMLNIQSVNDKSAFNSLAPGRFSNDIIGVVSKCMLRVQFMRTSYEMFLIGIPQITSDDKSTSFQVTANQFYEGYLWVE